MIFFYPKSSRTDEEVFNFTLTVIEYLGAPVRMLALLGIRILIQRLSVKISQSVGIPREVSRNPVQYDTDTVLVKVIHKICKICRSAVTAGRRIVARHLISPGTVIWIFANSHELHMGVAHFLDIFGNCHSKLSVCVEAFILTSRMSHEGTRMALIDRHRLFVHITGSTLFHPLFVCPLET